MSSLKFRNLNVGPEDPVDQWGVEGILTAIDRGSFEDWYKIRLAIEDDPFGEVSDDTEVALALAESEGAKAYIEHSLKVARMSDKERFAATFRRWVRESGLTRVELAAHLGTSTSRLSTYESGRVTPSAVIAEKVRILGVKRRRQWVL